MDEARAAAGNAPSFSPLRRDTLKFTGLGLLAPGLLWSCGAGGDDGVTYAATIAEARAAILKALADTDTSAATVALIAGDRVVWAEAFGVIDKATGAAPDTDTLFCIGSVSKMIAAIATMILVDRGRVDLDAPLARYVTDFRMASPEYAQITVRMLLAHTSGFPGSESRNIFTLEVPVLDYASQAQRTLATARLKDPPGELAVYCNDGFTMVEPLVAAVSGKSYPQFVQDEILTPLGMTRSRFPLAAFPAGTYALAYRSGVRQPQEYVNAHASGSLYSTPSDMAQLAIMLMHEGLRGGRRILSAAAVAEMGRNQCASLPFNPLPSNDFGLGWDGVLQPGLAAVGITAWHKNGGTSLYGSDFFVAPHERLAVMISGTSLKYGSARIAELIMLHALDERGRIARVPAPLPPTPRPERAATDAELAAISGCYANFSAVLRVQAQADRSLTLSEDDDGTWRATATGLKLRDDGTFSTDAEPHVAYRLLTAAGRRYLARRSAPGYGHYETETLYGQRMEGKAAISAAWQARVGRQWLTANENRHAAMPNFDLALHAVAELPGYVVTSAGQIVDPAASDTRAQMCLKIPRTGSRDLDDVLVETRGGEEWLRAGSFVYRPLATVPAIVAGLSAVTIGSEGYGEWRRTPATGSVTVAGATAWVLFDADLGSPVFVDGTGSRPLPGRGSAAYLLVYGAAGTTIGVTLA